MLFRVNMIFYCSWPKKSVKIDFSHLCVNMDTSVHNLSFFTKNTGLIRYPGETSILYYQ